MKLLSISLPETNQRVNVIPAVDCYLYMRSAKLVWAFGLPQKLAPLLKDVPSFRNEEA